MSTAVGNETLGHLSRSPGLFDEHAKQGGQVKTLVFSSRGNQVIYNERQVSGSRKMLVVVSAMLRGMCTEAIKEKKQLRAALPVRQEGVWAWRLVGFAFGKSLLRVLACCGLCSNGTRHCCSRCMRSMASGSTCSRCSATLTYPRMSIAGRSRDDITWARASKSRILVHSRVVVECAEMGSRPSRQGCGGATIRLDFLVLIEGECDQIIHMDQHT